MFWSLIAPEIVMLWAMRQWVGARKVEKKYREFGWTKTHGFFIQMGGFVLFDGGEPKGILSLEWLEELYAGDQIDFPKITEAEIDDRSKGDPLGKGLVVLQTSWFIAQCIARASQQLVVTEMELVTLAFATLNGLMYFFWWNKPLDVRCPVPVYIKATTVQVHPQENADEPSSAVSSEPDNPPIVEKRRSITQTKGGPTEITAPSTQPIKYPPVLQLPPTPNSTTEPGVRRSSSTRDTPRDTPGTGLEMKKILMKILLGGPQSLHDGIHVLIDSVSLARHIDDVARGKTRAPTFYALPMAYEEVDHSHLITALTGTIFGAMHCIGWFFQFPTVSEKLLWRATSTFIAVFPPFLGILFHGHVFFRVGFANKVWNVILHVFRLIAPIGILLYIPARIYLLVEACISLRNLPPSALETVQWVLFFPHV